MADAATRRGGRVRAVLVAAAWLAALAALVFRGRLYVIFNADSALFPMMGIDVRSWGGHWSEWMVGHIPYTFPDYALYRVVNALVPRAQTALVVTGLTQCVIGLAGWSALAARMVREPWARTCVLCLLPCVLAFEIAIPPFDHDVWYLVSIVHHGGILVVAPWSLLLAREAAVAERRATQLEAVAGWLVLGVIMIGSDRLSAIQVFSPTAFLVAAAFARRSIARGAGAFVALGVAGAGGVFLQRFLLPHPFHAPLRPPGTGFLEVVRSAVSLIAFEWSIAPGPMLLMCSALLFGALVAGVALWRGRYSFEERVDRALVGGLALTSLFVVVIAAAVAGPPFLLQSQRHIAFCFVAATFTAPITLGLVWPRTLGHFEQKGAGAVAAAASIFAILGITGVTGNQPPPATQEAPGGGIIRIEQAQTSECLNAETAARGLSTGLAMYWDAKLYSVLSGGRVHLIQVDQWLHQVEWVSNVEWANRFSPDFVLVDVGEPPPQTWRPTEAHTRELFGPPSETFSCSTVKGLVYQGDAQRRIAIGWHLLRSDPFDSPGDAITYSVGSLPGNGVVEGASRVGVEGPPTILTFGPFMVLHPGEYRATIAASRTRAKEGETVGGWDIVLWDEGQPNVIARDDLGSSSEPIVVPFRVEPRDWKRLVEVRTFYSGKGLLRVDGVTIRRER